MVFIAGGPGITALNPEQILGRLAPALADRHDLVVFDQRGAGYSEPRFCRSLAADYARLDALDLSATQLAAGRRAADVSCLAEMNRLDLNPAADTTGAVVLDLDDLRRALGYERWILIGSSVRRIGGAACDA